MDTDPFKRRSRHAVIALASTLALAGCGIPDPTGPVEKGIQGPMEEMPLPPLPPEPATEGLRTD